MFVPPVSTVLALVVAGGRFVSGSHLDDPGTNILFFLTAVAPLRPTVFRTFLSIVVVDNLQVASLLLGQLEDEGTL